MTTTRKRIAALVLAAMVSATAAFVASATFASDAHAGFNYIEQENLAGTLRGANIGIDEG